MSSAFEIREHVLETQHIREYARATAHNQEEACYLAIKQYIPKDNPSPKAGDITIIGAHANGFPKELYEAFWEELHARSKTNGFTIRSIWIADVAQQGASSVLNEGTLGNDPSWWDHSRDLLHMINHFRAEMPMPFVGVGHSMGGAQITNLAYIHPRLFTTVVLLDPVIQDNGPTGASLKVITESGYVPARMSTYRRDVWPSRAEAAATFKKSPFYKAWDERVLNAWIKHGLRDKPTALYPDKKGDEVTLTTTTHNEVMTFLRPAENEYEDVPDLDPAYLPVIKQAPFYRNEIAEVFRRLPDLRPPVLYIFGETSPMSHPQLQELKMERTGTGTGGSGGVKAGRVDKVVLKGIGHLVAMEVPKQCADAAAPWIGKEISKWQAQLEKYKKWTQLSDFEKTTVMPGWREKLGALPARPSAKKAKAKI